MAKRLYVLSIDSMVWEDTEYMKTLPNLGPIISASSYVKEVTSVYPTLTFTVHASMLTGVYPDRHNVINNERFLPGVVPAPWYYDRSIFDPDVDDLITAAKRSGYSTASILWPVTGGIEADYLLPEAWDWDDPHSEGMYRTMVEHGSSAAFLDEFWKTHGGYLNGNKLPYYQSLGHAATLSAIYNHQPEVIFEHLTVVDAMRHRYGVFADEVYSLGYVIMDMAFGEKVRALKELGLYDDTTFVITSDHGQTPVTRLVSPNTLLVRDGLIRLNADGTLKDWDAFFSSCAHSTQVFLSDPSDSQLVGRVAERLAHYQEVEQIGIETIYTRSEVAEKFRLDGSFSFVLEGADGVSFSNNMTGPLVYDADNSDYKYSVATHGHEPQKGPKPSFFLCGPGVRQNVMVESCDIVDQAPTLAALMGIELKAYDGRVLHELLV